MNGYTFRNAASRARLERVLKLLAAPHTKLELAEATNIGHNAMKHYLNALKADGKIYIFAWQPNSPGSPSPIYLAGEGKDKRRPRAMTAAQKTRAHRLRSPESFVIEMERKRLQRIKPAADPLAVALFGVAA